MSHDRLLRSGLRVSIFAAVWTLVASGVGIWIGVTLGSLSLIAFGGVGLLDAAGSITLIAHFRLARSGAASADHMERVAFRVIMAGLLAVAASTAVVSVFHLLDHDGAEQSFAGALVASASVVVLTLLAFRKRWVALRIPSRSLRADGQLSAIGAVLAAVALFGTSANDLFGWWWADSVAALGVATMAAFLGVEMAREPRTTGLARITPRQVLDAPAARQICRTGGAAPGTVVSNADECGHTWSRPVSRQLRSTRSSEDTCSNPVPGGAAGCP